jgi:hypothetical protein
MHFSHCIAYVCYKSDFPGIYKIVEDGAWVMRSRKSKKDRQCKDKKKVQKVKGFMWSTILLIINHLSPHIIEQKRLQLKTLETQVILALDRHKKMWRV